MEKPKEDAEVRNQVGEIQEQGRAGGGGRKRDVGPLQKKIRGVVCSKKERVRGKTEERKRGFVLF